MCPDMWLSISKLPLDALLDNLSHKGINSCTPSRIYQLLKLQQCVHHCMPTHVAGVPQLEAALSITAAHLLDLQWYS